MKYYIVETDGHFWKQARGPFSLQDAVRLKKCCPYDVVITKQISKQEERKGKVADS